MAKDYPLLASAVLLLTLLLPQGALPLRLLRVEIPQYKLRGESAILQCHYDLGDDVLYSVKWYKDDEEFYRFVPKSTPQLTSYRVEGVKVDHHNSNDQHVLLRNVNLKSTGVYRCEVSAEAPSFASAQREGRMEVVFLPKEDPFITGPQDKLYQVGDEINLNCTSGKSYPASVLHWYINDKEVRQPELLVPLPQVVHTHGLVTSALGLRFTVLAHHFPQGSMRVRCVARVSPVLWEGGRESVVLRSPLVDDVREALLLVHGSGQRTAPPAPLVLLVVAAGAALAAAAAVAAPGAAPGRPRPRPRPLAS
ncbi:hypothetical protein R5R35_006239 [Gryllus longicercus]|uniref:Ig-like domain-containing protein n=1 Tax=Gryllus longicercus TaxID=2509291 RepID=A0AAN9WTL6_9ORTH